LSGEAGSSARTERGLDSLIGGGFPAVDAAGIDAKQNIDAVSGPFGDVGWRYAGIEPEGDRGVAKGVWPIREWGRDLLRCEGEDACGCPDVGVTGADDAASPGMEESAVRNGAELREVLAEDAHKGRWYRYSASGC
jgi:hypothetical protein